MNLVDFARIAITVFTLTGFGAFLIGLLALQTVASLILLGSLRGLFSYPYLKKHPNIYRSCQYQTETGEYRLTMNWLCHLKPRHMRPGPSEFLRFVVGQFF